MLELLDLRIVTRFPIVLVDDDGEGSHPGFPATSPHPEPGCTFRQHQLSARMAGGGLHQLSVLALATNVLSLRYLSINTCTRDTADSHRLWEVARGEGQTCTLHELDGHQRQQLWEEHQCMSLQEVSISQCLM
jgi:hypothetical protein